jgi:hypothetical protein
MHGGKSPLALSAAERRKESRMALLAVETFGLPREVDAHTALLEELYRTVGAVEWLGAVVADLERHDVVWGTTKIKEGGDDRGTTEAAAVNVWVQLWQAERKHLVAVSKACIDAGIEERRVRLAESQGAMLAGVMRAVLDAMFGALVDALGSYDAAVGVLRDRWPVLVAEIVPSQIRAVALEGATT